MAYLNGAADHGSAGAIVIPPAAGESPLAQSISPEQVLMIRARLVEPFDPAEIRWRVTATSTQQTKHGPVRRGQLVAYADQRAYTDRLNDVFGEWGWTRSYNVQVAQNFERVTRGGGNGQKQSTICAKVVVVSTVTIHGLGSHTGVGEEWADDENSATRAEAQAFKRACACFGLGRYLYDLDKVWEDLDQYNRPVRAPGLPEWALPGSARVSSRVGQQPRQGIVREEALAEVRRLCEVVGGGLSQFTLLKYGGVTDPARVGFAKLTVVLEKLTDIGRGIERLRVGAGVIGEKRYAAVCREVGLATESIDDIPDRESLKRLVEKVEREAGIREGSIGAARGRLLQAAREVADRTRRRLADVIRSASGGELQLENLKSLGDSDVARVEAAIQRLSG